MKTLAQNLDSIQQNAGIKDQGTLGDIISLIFKTYIFYAAGIGLLVYLISGGLQLMMSRGDPKAMQSAQGKITNALLGFIIVVFAYFLTQIIGDVLGVGVFKEIFK
ncbi:MAG: hypothetical protein AAB535_04275 [Patescibacteria group bacterium]